MLRRYRAKVWRPCLCAASDDRSETTHSSQRPQSTGAKCCWPFGLGWAHSHCHGLAKLELLCRNHLLAMLEQPSNSRGAFKASVCLLLSPSWVRCLMTDCTLSLLLASFQFMQANELESCAGNDSTSPECQTRARPANQAVGQPCSRCGISIW